MSLLNVNHRRAIIDRRAVADRLARLNAGKKLDGEAAPILRGALEQGRARSPGG